jgi:peptidoglycan DL-endopeptidase CwlO
MEQTITRIAVVVALAFLCFVGTASAAKAPPHAKHHRTVKAKATHKKPKPPARPRPHRVKRVHHKPKPKPPLGARAARLALRYVGVPYSWGGASPSQGFDCSGLVMYVYGRLGVRLPHYTVGQFGHGRRVSYRRLAPGDLVFFSGLNHVGLYLGSGRFIDAPHSGAVVRVTLLASRLSSFVGARRLV